MCLSAVSAGATKVPQRELAEIVTNLAFDPSEGWEIVHKRDSKTWDHEHEVEELEHYLEITINAEAKNQVRIILHDLVWFEVWNAKPEAKWSFQTTFKAAFAFIKTAAADELAARPNLAYLGLSQRVAFLNELSCVVYLSCSQCIRFNKAIGSSFRTFMAFVTSIT